MTGGVPAWAVVVVLAVAGVFGALIWQGEKAADGGNLASGLQKSIDDKVRPGQQLLETTKVELWRACSEALENGMNLTDDCIESLESPPETAVATCESNRANGKPLTAGCSAYFAAQDTKGSP